MNAFLELFMSSGSVDFIFIVFNSCIIVCLFSASFDFFSTFQFTSFCPSNSTMAPSYMTWFVMRTCSTIWKMYQFTLMLWRLLTFPFIHITIWCFLSSLRTPITFNSRLLDSLCYRSENEDVHISFVYFSYIGNIKKCCCIRYDSLQIENELVPNKYYYRRYRFIAIFLLE